MPDPRTGAGRSKHGTQSGPPILLLTTDHSRRIVACCCAASSALGVRPGMTLAHARSLIGHDRIIEAEHEPQRDEAALRNLAAWSMRFTPLAAPDPPDGLLLDISGCAHLYGGERGLLNAIGNSLDRLGIANRTACAGTIGCAWALARFGRPDRWAIEPGHERSAIEGLPIESLRLDEQTIAALHEVNVDHVAEVMAIPRLELAARFSDTLLERIDQALGEAAEVIDPIRPAEPIMTERLFDGAVVDLEALLIVSRELIESVAGVLARRECGATRLELTLTRLDATPIRIALRFSHPSRDGRHLLSLLKPRIEQVNMGFGIERMTLRVAAARRLAHEQQERWGTHAGGGGGGAAIERATGELIDTLTQRLGAERALRMDVTESHRPERIAVFSPAVVATESKPSHAAIVADDRPSLLLDQPEPIEVMAVTPAPDGPPIWLRWRGMEHRITSAHGPQRISGEWWRRPRSRWHDSPSRAEHHNGDSTRDYFKVQNESGRWLWIYREPGGRWFMHGEWA